jgi:hypothetical protein
MSRGYGLPPDKVELARVLRGWSVTEMAKACELSMATASRASAGRPLSIETLRRLGRGFRQHPPNPEIRALLAMEIAEEAE